MKVQQDLRLVPRTSKTLNPTVPGRFGVDNGHSGVIQKPEKRVQSGLKWPFRSKGAARLEELDRFRALIA
jgi:hypothetical protein